MTEPRDEQPTGDETPQDHTGPAGPGPNDTGTNDTGTNDTGPMDQGGFDELEPHPDHIMGKNAEVNSKLVDEGESEADPKADSKADDESEKKSKTKDSSFLDHLEDLRSTLIQSTIAGLLATVICWFVSADLLDILVRPIKDQGVYFTAPNEAFLVRLKLAAAMGLFAVAPFIFFRIYMFIMPGLYKKEKKVVTPLLITTSLLFYTGVSFGFLIVVPQVMIFLMSFGTAYLSPLIGVGQYFAFVSKLSLAFGLVFQLPLLVLFLSVIGVVKPKTLLRTWRYAILAIFALSALLTPPDVISQVMMAGPVLVLYWSSVLVALIVTRKRRKED